MNLELLAGSPLGALVAGRDGYLYGLTNADDKGSVYRVTPGNSPTVSTLYRFDSASGVKPYNPLVADRNGRFYGTTYEGGAFGMGTIFMVTPGAVNPVSVLYSYNETTGRADGSSLIVGADGRLYGTTSKNNSMNNDCGTIYRLTPGVSRSFEILHRFDRESCHHGVLMTAADGSLYLATFGSEDRIFTIKIGDHVSVASSPSDVRFDGLILLDSGGENVYGLALDRRNQDGGELFPLNWGSRIRVAFRSALRPDYMLDGKDGYFYGVSRKGGTHSLGALFRYMPGSRSFKLLYSFGGAGDGAYPSTPLTLHSDGYFYGIISRPSGRASMGRVFRFQPPSPCASNRSFARKSCK